MALKVVTEGGTFLLLLLLLLPLFLLFILKNLKSSRPPKTPPLPPGPKPWPVIGNILHVGKKPHLTLTSFAQTYGPLVSLRLGAQTLVVGSSSAAEMEILKTHDRVLSGRSVPFVSPAKSLEMNHISISWSFECNENWKYLPTLCRTELFSGAALEFQACLRETKVMDMVKYLSGMEGKVELLTAGTDTSASTIEWAMAELMKSAECMTKVHEELVREAGQDLPKESQLSQLTYLQVCVKESLRLHPPTPLMLPHRALDSCQVMNYTVPKNAQLVVNVWAIGRDPMSWEDPLKFKPERFLSSTLDFKGNDFEFLPFGAGRRICPGLPMAARHVPLVLASFV
ncbi:hypothetical protein RJ639_016053 [Escallonia herrerae]|uniref:Cytochrome P450 n=1 Tax=Escallonia herrerae TaxID=1293975 RepID=A0AA88VC51_9ASTE|nr:hypothetical protein RJ639_016053 [Escallonia herrerae]